MSDRMIDRATKASEAKKIGDGGVPVLPSNLLGNRRLILAKDLQAWVESLPNGVMAMTTWANRDPFAELDHALAGQRLLSRAIAEATERRDTRAMRSLSDLSNELGGDVDRLLKVTARVMGDD